MIKHKHITEPDDRGFQVRIVRQKKEYSRYFSHTLWRSKKKALSAAIHWRDQLLVVLGKSQNTIGVSQSPLPTKKTTGVRGVSRSIGYDARRDYHYLEYQVHWRTDGRARNRTFYVGSLKNVTADQDFHAFRTAVLFRKEFEECFVNKKQFRPERYKNWKTERFY